MKKLLLLLAFPLLFSCSSDDTEKIDIPEPVEKKISFKVVNSTKRDYNFIIISVYKYKNDTEDFDSLLPKGDLKIGGETSVMKTQYKYMRVYCSYDKEVPEGHKPETESTFYPGIHSHYELSEDSLNIIELGVSKGVY